jgi:hypothetical protein
MFKLQFGRKENTPNNVMNNRILLQNWFFHQNKSFFYTNQIKRMKPILRLKTVQKLKRRNSITKFYLSGKEVLKYQQQDTNMDEQDDESCCI